MWAFLRLGAPFRVLVYVGDYKLQRGSTFETYPLMLPSCEHLQQRQMVHQMTGVLDEHSLRLQLKDETQLKKVS